MKTWKDSSREIQKAPQISVNIFRACMPEIITKQKTYVITDCGKPKYVLISYRKMEKLLEGFNGK